jgi:hypothetical protein
MKKYVRVCLILVILATLFSSVTFVVAAPIECTIWWPTNSEANTRGKNFTARPVGGVLDAYYIQNGVENECTGVIDFDANRATSMFTLEEICMYFYEDVEYCEEIETFYLDNLILPDKEYVVVDPDNPDIVYTAGIWSFEVDADGGFTFIKTYYFEE